MARPKRSTASRPAAARSTSVNEPVGLNVYIDSKGRTVYYSPFEKKAWYVPAFEYKKFNRYRSRYMIAIASLMLLTVLMKEWFDLPLWIPIVISVGIWAGLEYSFYKFLHALQPVKHFSKEGFRHSYEIVMTEDDRKKVWIKCLLYLLLGVLIVVNAYMQNYDFWLILACYAALVFCLVQIVSLLYQLKKASVVAASSVRGSKVSPAKTLPKSSAKSLPSKGKKQA
jgi:hypothetical protein